jgi:hypothetical protein
MSLSQGCSRNFWCSGLSSWDTISHPRRPEYSDKYLRKLKTNNSKFMKQRLYTGLVTYNLNNQIIITFHYFVFVEEQSNYYNPLGAINCHSC